MGRTEQGPEPGGYSKGTLTTRERQQIHNELSVGRGTIGWGDGLVEVQGHRAKLSWGMNPALPDFEVHILSRMLHCRDFSYNTKDTKV